MKVKIIRDCFHNNVLYKAGTVAEVTLGQGEKLPRHLESLEPAKVEAPAKSAAKAKDKDLLS